ncbi:hypothetical protein WR25_23678 [Diploscapter pachys]|uniref:N-acetylphosphatidylethanolamine-hydrolyzing phospholipase D n=1 Tax=Diploscapter pachys TaxID=2018661 RepID=A0A2A2KSK3_9BILA|nr:hypothetical protein WR25_23678 [Diploscapter pachys]
MNSNEECSPLSDNPDFEKPVFKNNRYENPPTFTNWSGLPGVQAFFKWRVMEKDESNIPKCKEELERNLPVTFLKKFEPTKFSKLYATWLGHATVLVDIQGIKFITDPLWCDRASFTSFAGPKRYRPSPLNIENLPELDFGVISHDHYDHLDVEAVQKIDKLHNGKIRWFVPKGFEEWMATIGISNTEARPDKVAEMTWGEKKDLKIGDKTCTVWCLPAQHWCQRSTFDRNKRLWCSWAVKSPEKSFYFAGDTGFCDSEFKKIGEKLGPFDLAAIPIGAYEPNWFMKSQHINPREAVQVHKLIKSKFSIGIHWGTYHMGSYEFYLQPREDLKKYAQEEGVSNFVTMSPGEIWEDQENQAFE